MSAVRPTCGHRHCAGLKPAELLAADVVGALAGVADIDRVCEQSATGPKPDFRVLDGDRRIVVEVKRLTSGTMQRHNADRAKYLGPEPFHPAPTLGSTWLVFVDTTIARETFAAGGVSPKLDRLLRDLTSELERLESEGVTDGSHDPRIRRLTHSWTCSAVPNSPRGPGIIISESHGSKRSTDIEIDVVWFLGDWLTSDHAGNLRDSLREEAGQRVAVLVADTDGPAEGMIRTLGETVALPATALPLPTEVDAVILIGGGHVLDFGLDDGWRRHDLASLSC